MTNPMNRRDALSLIALTAAGGALAAQPGLAQDTQLSGPAICTITPETTEGPYYFDPALERADVTEGRPGRPTRLRLLIVDEDCRPIPGARVDIWHCDAEGIYSGYPNQPGGLDTRGQSFMRGTQFADASGFVEFATVYPGWYPGRTPHIHFKVFLNETTVLTGQLFFPDEATDRIYAAHAPYNARSTGRTRNDSDRIALRAGPEAVAMVEDTDDGALVTMTIGVEPPGRFGGMSFPSSG